MSFKNLANDHNGLYKAHNEGNHLSVHLYIETDEKKMRKGNRREWGVM